MRRVVTPLRTCEQRANHARWRFSLIRGLPSTIGDPRMFSPRIWTTQHVLREPVAYWTSAICGFHENGPKGGTCPADCLAACGDGKCQGGESVEFCPLDCGGCGDGKCGMGESNTTCSADCPADCGDGLCAGGGESPEKCPVDCLPPCGDGLCQSGENPYSCPSDCTTCGDQLCGASEDEESCPVDCMPPCGNGLCEGGESAAQCPVDCGWCGDDVCGYTETGTSCPGDCPALSCGDGLCQDILGEDDDTCPKDCWDDLDGDGAEDLTDNCPQVFNPEQENLDDDDDGDACDPDDDNDGELDATDCAPLDPVVFHGNTETCDGKDNDCANGVDDGLGSTTCGIGECQVTIYNCINGQETECVEKEPGYEICDGKDNDCDGEVDGLACIGCADGTREGYQDTQKYGHIAGCSGAWGGIFTPAVSLREPNHPVHDPWQCEVVGDSQYCPSPADLCAPGWHVCADEGVTVELIFALMKGPDFKCNSPEAGEGRWVAASSHCDENPGGWEGDCVYEDQPLSCKASMQCSEPFCCGTQCVQGACVSGLFPFNTYIPTYDQEVGNAGCANFSSAHADGVLCCRELGE